MNDPAAKTAPIFDLSEFDPYHTSKPSTPQLRTASPVIFSESRPSQPQSSASTLPPPIPQPLASEPVAQGQDPLDLFASLQLGTSTEASQGTIGRNGNLPSQGVAAGLNHVVQTHQNRQNRTLNDLERDPWAPLPSSPTSSAPPHGIPIPMRQSSHSRRKNSFQGQNSGSAFSPPRRLSGLMDQLGGMTSSSTPAVGATETLRPKVEIFHPSSPPLTSSDSFQRVRKISFTGSDENEWGDFLTATPEPKSTVPHQTAPIPPVNVWTPPPRLADAVQPIRLVGVRPGVARALDEDIADGIRPNLPPRLRISSEWKLLYSLDQHGISIGTLYDRMKLGLKGTESGVVVVVKDAQGSIFGGYVNQALKESKNYYGDGTCFLWKSIPFPAGDVRLGGFVKIFKWTGKNDYLILTESNFISIGGGDGKFGLWLDGVFEKGYTTSCPCFDNEPLTAKETWRKVEGREEAKFQIMQLECWAVSL